jgi:hypothetical protein
MTTPHRPSRPWYCNDALVEDYRESIAADGGDLSMFKALKLVRSIIVNLGIIGLGAYSLRLGADPTFVGGLAIATLAGYNGLELSDYLAALRAYSELQRETTDDTNE